MELIQVVMQTQPSIFQMEDGFVPSVKTTILVEE